MVQHDTANFQLRKAKVNWRLWGVFWPAVTFWYCQVWFEFLMMDIAYIWIAVLLYFSVFAVLFRKIITMEGSMQAHIIGDSLFVKFNLFGFTNNKVYKIKEIRKLRVMDKGNKKFEVGFNYGDQEDYINLGRGYSEKYAVTLCQKLNAALKGETK